MHTNPIQGPLKSFSEDYSSKYENENKFRKPPMTLNHFQKAAFARHIYTDFFSASNRRWSRWKIDHTVDPIA